MNQKSWLIPRVALVALLLGWAALAGGPSAHAFPEPSSAPRDWHFDFTHSQPQPIAIRTAEGIRWFWYMSYKVVNNTGQDRLFIPEIVMASDQGDILPSGKNVPAGVFDAVKTRLGNRLLQNPIRVVGRLLQGEDNARESVAIWPAFDHDVDEVSIFVSGIDGETQVIQNPLTGDGVTVVKTLMVRYGMPGTGGSPQRQSIVPRGETWVMR
jgi:hypothetical protein